MAILAGQKGAGLLETGKLNTQVQSMFRPRTARSCA